MERPEAEAPHPKRKTRRILLAAPGVIGVIVGAIGLGVGLSNPGSSRFFGPLPPLVAGTQVSTLRHLAPASNNPHRSAPSATPRVLFHNLPGSDHTRGWAVLSRRGSLARIGFDVSVPNHAFGVYLARGAHGQGLLAFQHGGVLLSATTYRVATLATYRWLTVLEVVRRGIPPRPILQLNLRTLAKRDSVVLKAGRQNRTP